MPKNYTLFPPQNQSLRGACACKWKRYWGTIQPQSAWETCCEVAQVAVGWCWTRHHWNKSWRTPPKGNMTMEQHPWMKMYLLSKMVIFQTVIYIYIYMLSPPQNQPKQHIHWYLQCKTPFCDHSLHYYHAHKNTKLILDINVHVYIYMYTYEIFKYIYIPPPKIYFLHPFVCPKFYQKAFCTIKKTSNKKQKQTNKQKNTHKTKKTLKKPREMSQPEFPQSLCFFRFTIASDTFLKKHFPWSTGLWYSLFP